LDLEALSLSLRCLVIDKSGPECTQPTCEQAYSKTNFTVVCVSYNFTVRHEIKTRCALGLP